MHNLWIFISLVANIKAEQLQLILKTARFPNQGIPTFVDGTEEFSICGGNSWKKHEVRVKVLQELI